MPASNQNELMLCCANRTVHLFYSTSTSSKIGVASKKSLRIFPSISDCAKAACTPRNASFFHLSLEVESFQDLFLSENHLNNVSLSFPKRSDEFMFFTVQGEVLHSCTTLANPIQLSEALMALFPVQYKFPSSFIVPCARNKFHIGQTPTKKATEEFQSKTRMIPAHEVYSRVTNDPCVNESMFIIGYLDRFSGIQEIEFTRFVTLDKEKHFNTSVPFHRVRHFKYKGVIVWNRETRLDLITHNRFANVAA